jgi:predicted transcriptional regulator
MFKGLWGARVRRGERDPLQTTLGSLEREVMEIVWRGPDQTVREVRAKLPRQIAYTTAMTTLDRLFKKGMVSRIRSGRAFVYRAAQSREELEAALASGVLEGLLSSGSPVALPILSNLVDAVGSGDGGRDLLDRLEQLVRDKRQRMENDDHE